MSIAAAARRVSTLPGHRDVVLHASLLLLLIQTVWRASTIVGSYFWQDDFNYLAEARSSGLTAEFLLQDYNGHLMPGQFLLVWLVSRLDYSFVAPAVMLVTLQLVASVLLLRVLWLLWPGRPEILVGYAVYLFSPLGLVADTWWAAGLQALPLQCSMLLGITACALDHRSPGRGWKLVTVVALVGGLVFWEKALLLVPLLVLVQLLLLEDARWRDRRDVVRRHLGEWSVWLLVGSAYTVGYVLLVGRSAPTGGARPSYEDFVVNAVAKTLLPGVLGGPWTDHGGANTVYPPPDPVALVLTGLAFVLLVGWAWSRQPRETGQALVLVVTYLAMDLGLVLLARSEFAALLARDPRYVTDALPVLALGVVAAVAPRAARPHDRVPWRPQDPLLRVCLAVCAVLVASSWISVQTLGEQLSHAYAKNYVTRLLDDERAMPDAVIVNASAPPIGVVAQPVGTIFAAAGASPRLDEPSADLRMADGFGVLAPVTVPNPDFAVTGPRPGCGWLVTSGTTQVRTGSIRAGPRRVVQLGYTAARETAVLVSVAPHGDGDSLQSMQSIHSMHSIHYVSVPRGVGHISVVTAGAVPVVAFSRAAGESSLCVTNLSIGLPWPAG